MAEVRENWKYDGSEASASTHSLSFGFTATAGRLLILGLSAPGGAVTINSIDSGWVEIGNGASGTRTFTPHWYYKIATGGETGVSVTYSASQAINWAVEEWSGLAASSVLDQAAENETYLNTSTTSLASGTTATLSISDGFAISFLACDVSSGWNAGTTVSDGYTTTGYNDQPGPGCGFAYKKLSGTSGASTTWSTTDAGEQTYAAIAVFKPAAGGATTYTHTASLNAAIQAAQSATASLSAAIQQPNSATASLSAAIRQALASTASVDAAIQQARTATASLDALIQAAGSNTATASLDAAVQQAFAASAALDAAIRSTGTATASLDAVVQQARTLQAALDAFIEAPGTLSASLDAAIQAPHTASASLSAAIAAAQTAVASLDAAIATRYTHTASLDGYIHEASTITASLDAAILAAQSVSASLNAYIVEAGVVVLGAARAGARDLSTSRRVNLSTSRRR